MSSPYALPVGPTRRAESSTSMPPPEPRASTTSPGCSSASAVGLPQPSEASTACSGRVAVSAASYRLALTGSQPSLAAAPPQQAPPCPCSTRRAASPYFARTVSLITESSVIGPRSSYSTNVNASTTVDKRGPPGDTEPRATRTRDCSEDLGFARGPRSFLGGSHWKRGCMQVTLGENDRLDFVLKKFRRQIAKAGLFQDMKRKRFFEGPSAQRRRKDKAAARRKAKSAHRREHQ